MALRTAQQYLDSLRDGRVVYYAGERIRDVVDHAHFGLRARANAAQYGRGAADDAETLAARTVTLPDGEVIHRWHQPPRSQEDLLKFVAMEEEMPGDAHGAMAAGITGLQIVARKMDAKFGTAYTPRIDAYADWYARNDLHGAFAMTDAKGDRSKPPSGQADPDLWVRVVERRADGIVIRGAKTSVTSAALANELLVLPTHGMASNPERRFSQSRAIALDMESATIAANGFRFRVPYGTLLCISDKPLHGEIKLPGMANQFYRERVSQHLQIGLRAIERLRENGLDRLHSRKLRSFAEVAFQ